MTANSGPPVEPGSQRSASDTAASEAAATGVSPEALLPDESGAGGALRGTIALDPSACTSCMLCARECPDWCIHIDSHTESLPETTQGPGARQRKVHVLDRFAIDFGLCLYCGICIDVCPFDALAWAPEPTSPALTATGLVHEIHALSAAWPTPPTA